MRIVIDGMEILHEARGIKRYSVGLIRGLMSIDRENSYVVFYHRFRKTPYGPLDVSSSPNFRERILPLPGRVVQRLWSHGLLPIETIVRNADIFHSLHSTLPPRRRAKLVLTVHGLDHIEVPQYMEPGYAAVYSSFLDKAARSFDFFICVSETLRRFFLETFKLSPERVRAVPHGVGTEFHTGPKDLAAEEVKKRFGIEGRYILYVGGIETRKNVHGILETFAILCHKKSFEHCLVLAGDRRNEPADLGARIQELGLPERVILTGRLPWETADLPLLYQAADVFLFPSHSEGFGIPLLEAMACGTPIVAGNVSAVPEVAGNAALLVNPRKPDEIADAVRRVLDDERLRKDLVERGLARAKLFTWERAARETLNLYREWAG